MEEKEFENNEENAPISEEVVTKEEIAEEPVFDEAAINEVKEFEKSVDLTTRQMIIGSALAFGIVIALIIIIGAFL